MRKIICFTLITAALAGCKKDWPVDEVVMLENIEVVSGKHCESSAIVNALHYLGYDIDETTLFGAGGGISFLYQKGTFPFIGGRSGNLREAALDTLGITWFVERPGKDDSKWDKIIHLLKSGYPVVLRVDMRYLPYLWGGRYGKSYTSFGWHLVTLFGIDSRIGLAYVSDTERSELQEIKLKDLDKARSSSTKIFPPENEFYWIEKKPAGYGFDWRIITQRSIEQVIRNMEENDPAVWNDAENLMGINGLKQFGNELASIENTVKPYLLPSLFNFFYGSIETNGTGGAAFRIFYRDFLKKTGQELNDPGIIKASEYTDACADAWHNLADEFRKLSGQIKGIKNKEERISRYNKAVFLAVELYNCEQELYSYLKKIGR